MEDYSEGYISRIDENIVWTKLDKSIMIIDSAENDEHAFMLNKTAAFLC